MNWLVGDWSREYNGVTQSEKWTIKNDSILGSSYFISKKDSSLMSTFIIAIENNEINLLTQEIGFESKVDYQLTYFSADSLMFETTQPIWPQTIMFYHESEKIYVKSLAGVQQQMKNFVHFKFSRD